MKPMVTILSTISMMKRTVKSLSIPFRAVAKPESGSPRGSSIASMTLLTTIRTRTTLSNLGCATMLAACILKAFSGPKTYSALPSRGKIFFSSSFFTRLRFAGTEFLASSFAVSLSPFIKSPRLSVMFLANLCAMDGLLWATVVLKPVARGPAELTGATPESGAGEDCALLCFSMFSNAFAASSFFSSSSAAWPSSSSLPKLFSRMARKSVMTMNMPKVMRETK
mmetsp:Transcript_1325/g.2290  ORF Transcript_1325/g.2290 Transcript_1325/m.2290 type:complete len:224 (-) Transcript_1325:1161-1832(-)